MKKQTPASLEDLKKVGDGVISEVNLNSKADFYIDKDLNVYAVDEDVKAN